MNLFKFFSTGSIKILTAYTLTLLFTLLYTLNLWAHKKYIDSHAHIASFGYESDCYVSEKMKESYKFYGYQYLFGLSEKKAMQKGDAYLFDVLNEQIIDSEWVKQIVLLAMDQVYNKKGEVQKDKTEFYIPNDYIAKNIKKYSTFLLGASVHPFRKDALKALEKVKLQGAVLVKLLPAIQKFQPDDPQIKDYYLKLKELDLPLLIHVDDEKAFSKSHVQYTDPSTLEFPLKLGVTVICAHAASMGHKNEKNNFQTFLTLAKKYKNLYADISGLMIKKTRFGHLKKVLADKELHSRLIYGSDFPLSSQIMSSPFYYREELGFFNALGMTLTSNTWDRNIELKKAMGTPESIFLNTEKLLLKNQKANSQAAVFEK